MFQGDRPNDFQNVKRVFFVSKLNKFIQQIIFLLKMGIKSIKSVQDPGQVTLNAVFTYQDMVRYKKNQKISQNFQFLELIGTGAQGQVYKGICKKTGNVRAIKKINKFRKTQTKQNLQSQFNILKQIDHPNIVKMYEMFEQDNYIYIVTELCQGKELFQLILQDKVVGQEAAFPLFYQILTTVNFLHKTKIMHRDIKPENIIVNQLTNSIKLIDLGTAIKFQDSQLRQRKRIGTSYYIAPQVLRRQYNEKCDIWSLGVILYILLSGSLPFKGKQDMDILRSVQNDELQFPTNKWKNVSFSAKQLVKKLLQRQVSKRLSGDEILQSSWVRANILKMNKQNSNNFNQKIINAHLSNMKKFKELKSNPIQDGIFIFIVNFVQNKNGDQKQFLQTFRALDTNRDGVLSHQQLTTGLEIYLNLKKTECEIISKQIFAKVDINNSGSIDYSEFVMSASNIEIVVNEENIDMAFNYIDVDHSGKLSIRQIRQKLGNSITEQQYNSMLKQFDKNSDGEISKYEFRDMMKALVKNTSVNGRKPTMNLTGKPAVNLTSLSKPNGILKRSSVSKSVKK